mmetsp:Transcript_65242/g.181375  ORF Transcript_65242/g.181375 Transcript_65242/m.181375 type:complete len:98 (-) Transcript_65242:165-458(-)
MGDIPGGAGRLAPSVGAEAIARLTWCKGEAAVPPLEPPTPIAVLAPPRPPQGSVAMAGRPGMAAPPGAPASGGNTLWTTARCLPVDTVGSSVAVLAL